MRMDTKERPSGIEFRHSTFAAAPQLWKCREITSYVVEQKVRLVRHIRDFVPGKGKTRNFFWQSVIRHGTTVNSLPQRSLNHANSQISRNWPRSISLPRHSQLCDPFVKNSFCFIIILLLGNIYGVCCGYEQINIRNTMFLSCSSIILIDCFVWKVGIEKSRIFSRYSEINSEVYERSEKDSHIF